MVQSRASRVAAGAVAAVVVVGAAVVAVGRPVWADREFGTRRHSADARWDLPFSSWELDYRQLCVLLQLCPLLH